MNNPFRSKSSLILFGMVLTKNYLNVFKDGIKSLWLHPEMHMNLLDAIKKFKPEGYRISKIDNHLTLHSLKIFYDKPFGDINEADIEIEHVGETIYLKMDFEEIYEFVDKAGNKLEKQKPIKKCMRHLSL